MSTPICNFYWPEWDCKLVTPSYMTCMAMDEIVRVTNGCGREGIESMLVPDTIWGLDISPVCRVHDIMYQYATSLEDENFADAIMGANLISLIKQKTKWRILQWLRLRRAYKYINAVALTNCVSVAMLEDLGIKDMVC